MHYRGRHSDRDFYEDNFFREPEEDLKKEKIEVDVMLDKMNISECNGKCKECNKL